MENLKLYLVRRMENGGYLNGEPNIFKDFNILSKELDKVCKMYNLKIDKVDEEITTINVAVFLDLLEKNTIFWLHQKEVLENEGNAYYEVRRHWNVDNSISYL